MAKGTSDRQAAMRLFARGVDLLQEEGALGPDDVRALLPVWRALHPEAHPLAGADVIDCGTLARTAAWSKELLSAHTIVARPGAFRTPPSVTPIDERRVTMDGVSAGVALALTLTLTLEAAKRGHGLGAPADDLKQAFSTPEAARDTLAALEHGGDARTVSFDSTDDATAGAVADAVDDRPAYVFCAAAARAAHDLLSPYARRLGARLSLAGREHGASDDDAYRGIERVERLAPSSVSERLAAEEADGLLLCGRALVIRTDSAREASFDRRVREAAVALKKARAAVVCVADGAALDAALQGLHGHVRAVFIVTEATRGAAPAALVDPHGVLIPIVDGALKGAPEETAREGLLTSLPSLMALPLDSDDLVDAGSFPLVQAALRARFSDPSPLAVDAPVIVRAVPREDREALSAAVLALFARVAATMTAARSAPRSAPRGRR